LLLCEFLSFKFQCTIYWLLNLIMSSDVTVIMRKVGLIGSMIVRSLPFNTALGVGLGIGLTVTFCFLFCTYPIRNIAVEVQFSLLPSIG